MAGGIRNITAAELHGSNRVREIHKFAEQSAANGHQTGDRSDAHNGDQQEVFDKNATAIVADEAPQTAEHGDDMTHGTTPRVKKGVAGDESSVIHAAHLAPRYARFPSAYLKFRPTREVCCTASFRASIATVLRFVRDASIAKPARKWSLRNVHAARFTIEAVGSL